jgi:hypothetical protein
MNEEKRAYYAMYGKFPGPNVEFKTWTNDEYLLKEAAQQGGYIQIKKGIRVPMVPKEKTGCQ